jgi:hypothetical protein
VEQLKRVSRLLLSLLELCSLFIFILGLYEFGLFFNVMAVVIPMLKCTSEKTFMPGGSEEREKVCVDIEALVVRTPHCPEGLHP